MTTKTDAIQIDSLRPTIAELERMLQWSFKSLGMDKLYLDRQGLAEQLERVTVVIETSGTRKNLLGHFLCKTAQSAWRTREGEEISEIKISSEHLRQDPVEIAHTIIHEAVHLWNWYLGLKDCSSGGAYHNKTFKEQAELVGLKTGDQSVPGHGFAHTKLSEELEEKIRKSLKPKLAAFQIFKDAAPKVKTVKKPKLALWECECVIKIRVAYDTVLDAECHECGVDFIKKN
jgi:hypothetical protein